MIHLGMSGSLRHISAEQPLEKHDHAQWRLPGVRIVYNDPRRFGAILWHRKADGPIEQHPLLSRLGVEPFSDEFTAQTLIKGFKNRRQAVKNTLLSGHIVVGVGNIYASEALFKAGINPQAPAGSLSAYRLTRLHRAIVDTLQAALDAGGSTIRDYLNATGEAGAYFELHAQVYDRAGQPCPRCQRPIKRIIQAQRATYFCSRCQRR